MAEEIAVITAGRPRALDEDGLEFVGYLVCCRAPDLHVSGLVGDAVWLDVAEEEEFLAGRVMPDEIRRGFVCAFVDRQRQFRDVCFYSPIVALRPWLTGIIRTEISRFMFLYLLSA